MLLDNIVPFVAVEEYNLYISATVEIVSLSESTITAQSLAFPFPHLSDFRFPSFARFRTSATTKTLIVEIACPGGVFRNLPPVL